MIPRTQFILTKKWICNIINYRNNYDTKSKLLSYIKRKYREEKETKELT